MNVPVVEKPTIGMNVAQKISQTVGRFLYGRSLMERYDATYTFYGLHDPEVKEHAKRVWYLAPGELIESCLRIVNNRHSKKISEMNDELRRIQFQYIDPYNFNG